MEIRNFLERWTSSPTDPRVYMSLCFRFFDLYSCVTCVHSVLEERVNGSTRRIRDPFMLFFTFSSLSILVLAPFLSISRRSSSSSYFYLFSSVHCQVRARWPRCGIAWKSESWVSLRKTVLFPLSLVFSDERRKSSKSPHAWDPDFYFILFYFILFYFIFFSFSFFSLFALWRGQRDSTSWYYSLLLSRRCPPASVVIGQRWQRRGVPNVASGLPTERRRLLVRCHPIVLFFFFLVVERAITWWTSSPSTWLCCRVPDCSIPSFRCSVSTPVDRSRCSRNGDTSPGASGCRSVAEPRRTCSALAAPCYGSLFRALASPGLPENCRRVLEALFATTRRRNCYTANFVNHSIRAKKCV